MKHVSATLTVVLVALFLPWLAYSQEAKAPVYKDGDWWKIKYKVTHGSVSRSCIFKYSEYVVKIVKGKAKVICVFSLFTFEDQRYHRGIFHLRFP